MAKVYLKTFNTCKPELERLTAIETIEDLASLSCLAPCTLHRSVFLVFTFLVFCLRYKEFVQKYRPAVALPGLEVQIQSNDTFKDLVNERTPLWNVNFLLEDNLDHNFLADYLESRNSLRVSYIISFPVHFCFFFELHRNFFGLLFPFVSHKTSTNLT